MINRYSPRFLYTTLYPVLLIIVVFLSCTSVPVITDESAEDPTNADKYPEPGKAEKIKRDTPPFLSEKVIFYDEFDNNAHGWKTGEEIDTQYRLEKGYYIIDNAHDSNEAFSTIPLRLDYNGNFIIESTIMKIAGDGECSYGIAWGYDPKTGNTQYVIIYKNYVLYGKRQSGKWETLINWRQSSFLNIHNQKNKIAIKRNNRFIEIFINEQLIFTMDSLENFGGNTGFILFGNIMVKADFLLITEFSIPDNEAPAGFARTEFLVTPGHEYLFEESGIQVTEPLR